MSKPGFLDQVLSGPEDLPKSSHVVVQTLFVLLQLMYLGFYVGALCNLAEIRELIAALPHPTQIFTVLISTAAVLIPVRAFLLCAVLFRAPRLREKFLKLWWLLLPLDIAVGPISLSAAPSHQFGVGAGVHDPSGLLSIRATVAHPDGRRRRGTGGAGHRPITTDGARIFIATRPAFE